MSTIRRPGTLRQWIALTLGLVAILTVLGGGATIFFRWPDIQLIWCTHRLFVGNDVRAQLAAVSRLAALRSKGGPLLLRVAVSDHFVASVSVAAVQALGEIGEKGAFSQLKETLAATDADTSVEYRAALVKSLGAIDAVRALTPMVDVLVALEREARKAPGGISVSAEEARETELVRRAAEETLVEVGARNPQDLVTAITTVLGRRGLDPCDVPARALARLLDRVGAPVVRPLLRSSPIWLFGGMPSASVRATLREAVKDDALREYARRALFELADEGGARDDVWFRDETLGSELRSLHECVPEGGLFAETTGSEPSVIGGERLMYAPNLIVTTWAREQMLRPLDTLDAIGGFGAAEVSAFGRIVSVVFDPTRDIMKPSTKWRVELTPAARQPLSLEQVRDALVARVGPTYVIDRGAVFGTVARFTMRDTADEWGEWSWVVMGLVTGKVLHVRSGPGAMRARISFENGGSEQVRRVFATVLEGCAQAATRWGMNEQIGVGVVYSTTALERAGAGAATPARVKQCIESRLRALEPGARMLGKTWSFNMFFEPG